MVTSRFSRPPGGPTRPAPDRQLLELRGVGKSFRTEAGAFDALRDVDLRIERGEFVAVMGKSGSGKSTLVNMIAGIDRPTEGEVWVASTPLHRLGENALARFRGRTVGVVFQFFQLLPTLTAVENVMLPMDFCGTVARGTRRSRAMAMLAEVGMAEHADKLPLSISGGEQQRVAIARALANDPPLVLADEPTGNLDSRTAESVISLFERLVGAGKTIVMVTHDRELSMRAPRQILLADGRIVADRGTPPGPAACAAAYAT